MPLVFLSLVLIKIMALTVFCYLHSLDQIVKLNKKFKYFLIVNFNTDGYLVLGHVLEHLSREDQVEGTFLERIRADVVLAHFEIGRGHLVEEARLQVGGNDSALKANAMTEPARDRAGAGADFETAPTLVYPDRRKAFNREGIATALHRGEPFPLMLPRMLELV